MYRKIPNILITGTPGVGKTTIAKYVAEELGMLHLDLNQMCIDNAYVQEYDDRYDISLVDEDKIIDLIVHDLLIGEDMIGNCVLDYDTPNLFPDQWIDEVFVIQTKPNILYHRLVRRGYADSKLDYHITNEEHQLVLDEVREIYPNNLYQIIHNNHLGQLNDGVERIKKWCNWFKKAMKNIPTRL